ncbi:hypothetical protein AB0M02_23595 [Actinoplanes sp. NPDC051861]|uniref:NACHT domain-containing protein n=1 Tax=Actinoplanes sp. NPDC051861 TaxID=3155170 RepID=UPI003412BCF0
MAKGLTYVDAVKLLGGPGPLLKFADNVAGGALSAATLGGSDAALSFFDAKTEAVRLGAVVSGFVRGNGRYNRNQRLQAAHGVLVVAAFFEAVDTCLDAAGLGSSNLSRDQQVQLVAAAEAPGSWPDWLQRSAIPSPRPDRSFDSLLASLHTWFDLSATLTANHLGMADAGHYLAAHVPNIAVARYEENVRRLTEELPEFALWMRYLSDRAATRGLEALEATLLKATSHRDPQRHRQALTLTYRAELGKPILGGDAGELTMPALGTGYLDPLYRVKVATPGARPAEEDWWDTEVRDDLADFLGAYLTTPQAADTPMLLLGQPGAGKSSLTRVLAARLPAADFLVVRVVLREVPAEAEIQDQVEQAVRAAIGETVAWPDLARDADGAMPVILLDGFDELLQVTGIHQSDYLQRVVRFQEREATLGRPVAVIVTSRTAVADRARVPTGSLTVRLEPFDGPHQRRWLEIWNGANVAHWARGTRPLTPEVLGRFPDLAQQPLLLLMLALYDAAGNALQDAGESFGTGQLYENLLHEFAAREVRRVHGDQPDARMPALVEQELLRLSVVAFAMSHRLRLWVTTEELDADLTGLGLQPSSAQHGGFRTAITAGQEMVGRFFFIQRAQALQDDRTKETYEFLHATFGEYLVARLVVHAVTDASARAQARTLHLGSADDDGLLQSLLGYTPLCARNTVLPFVADLIKFPGVNEIREWLVDRLRVAVTRPAYAQRAYQPVDKRIDHWMATYSFNLMLLTLACGGPLHASDLYRHAKAPAAWLRDMSLQWRAAVPGGMYLEALEPIAVTRTWTADGRRDLRLEHSPGAAAGSVDSLWSLSFGDTSPVESSQYFPISAALKSMHLSGAFSDDALRHALDPMLDRSPELAVSFVSHGPKDVESVLHSLVALWLASARRADPGELVAAYQRAVTAVRVSRSRDVGAMVLNTLTSDTHRLGRPAVLALLRRLLPDRDALVETAPESFVDCLLTVPAEGADALDEELLIALMRDAIDSLSNRPELAGRVYTALTRLTH